MTALSAKALDARVRSSRRRGRGNNAAKIARFRGRGSSKQRRCTHVLEKQHVDDTFDADYLVVGSGFGGSACALRLTEKGYRVLMLERGREL
ncbi:MAG TPA: NAD(P)-binding protein, partial [Polyangiaceae bacterium]